MNKIGFPRLPLRYRLAWTLLWFALLGALALFGGRSPAPAATRPQMRQAGLSGAEAGGGEPTHERARSGGAAAAGAAFRQP